ncbi:response regulator [Melittangium boletus]|uniref:Chemotaxis protein CheY n=1 Tax=Melittangium boletus DSM 14713 TaxID=1294270 RepID=A0A250I8D7_9BACT|nr:response regulator [Melittangium boletus]ATB28139.1 chemotaxis protein CheY [Melittangium boletus DSM 14713]
MKPRVLIVDDSWSMRQTLRFLLAPDFDCALAEDGVSALEHARTHPPDIIVSDVSMEGMDGYELCRRVRAEAPLREVPFLFLSGHEPRPDTPESDLPYLVKPVEPSRLIARLHELVTTSRPVPAQTGS